MSYSLSATSDAIFKSVCHAAASADEVHFVTTSHFAQRLLRYEDLPVFNLYFVKRSHIALQLQITTNCTNYPRKKDL